MPLPPPPLSIPPFSKADLMMALVWFPMHPTHLGETPESGCCFFSYPWDDPFPPPSSRTLPSHLGPLLSYKCSTLKALSSSPIFSSPLKYSGPKLPLPFPGSLRISSLPFSPIVNRPLVESEGPLWFVWPVVQFRSPPFRFLDRLFVFPLFVAPRTNSPSSNLLVLGRFPDTGIRIAYLSSLRFIS